MLGAPLRPRSIARRLFLAPLLGPLVGGLLVVGAGAAAAAPASHATHASHTTSASHTTHASHTTAPASHTSAPASARVSSRVALVQKRAQFGSDVLALASRHAGAPYVYGASGPGAFDCSGFTSYVFRAMGISLPHTSYGQFAMTEHIPRSQARPGDLVFLNGLGHVGIYAGNGMMWDAPSPGGRVSERPIYSSAYLIGRVLL